VNAHYKTSGAHSQTLSIIITRMLYISPTTVAAHKHLEARQNLEDARRLGKERGEARRQELRKWIEEGGLKGVRSDVGHGGPQQVSQRAKSLDGTSGPIQDE
jgi:ABC-type multidrug transport system ATPase subunit